MIKNTNFKRLFILAAMSITYVLSFAQSHSVSGVVKDAAGEAMIGVSVKEKGTSTGTITDFNGKYTITVADRATLVFSYVGYLAQEVATAGKSVINVTLEEDNEQLDEVVVVGYGTMRRRDLTGSIQSVRSSDLTAIPTNNVLEVLQGKVAGLDMTKSSGQAGSGVSFVIRGNRSLNKKEAANEPLVIVDGFPYGNTIDISPSDIESIEILKDAASTAIYGTRGANGVILITTKKGRVEKTSVNFNSYVTVNNVANYIESFSGQEYIKHREEGARTTNGNEWATGSFVANPYKTFEQVFPNAAERAYIEAGQFEDWLSMIFRTGITQNYDLSVSGGNATTKYSTSMGYMNEEGVIPGNAMQRYNARMNLTQKILPT
ncbi:MAG: SusC/RagA family TonB-linked outer membrane protein, partial [Paludibacter sp.]|nr:SusC/RagA family TonB-linked outer membrane protein [Paludibacter sp.]